MLYDEETLRGAVLRVYEYLSNQYVAEKRPHQYKPDKPVHRKALDGFVKSLPDSAGFDFIWRFLTYQFYIFEGQNHERRPLMQWFLGKEAWRRWNDYDEGMKYHVVYTSNQGVCIDCPFDELCKELSYGIEEGYLQ